MTTDAVQLRVTRDTIVELLTDAEVAAASRDEGALLLDRDDEYVDLARLEVGIQKAQPRTRIESNTAVVRRSVSNETWMKIVKAMKRGGFPTGVDAEQTPRRATLWIDHDEAKIFQIEPEPLDSTVRAPHQHVRRELEESGRKDGSQHFFFAVARALADATEILVVGPSSAKLDFVRWVHAHDQVMQTRIVGVETLDHPTDRRLADYVRHYFLDRVHSKGVSPRSGAPATRLFD